MTETVQKIYVSGGGLFPLTQDPNGGWSLGVPTPGLEKAGYGFVSAQSGKLYFCREAGADSALLRCVVGQDGALIADGHWPSGGIGPCYIAGDATGNFVAIAHYGSGNAVVFRDGDTPELIADLQNAGHGSHPRQEAPHSHCARFSPNNTFVYTCDLGTDEILAYPFDDATGNVGERIVAFKTPPGSGPRHITFTASGEHAFVVTELANTVIALRANADGTLTELQSVRSLPDEFTGESFAAHLALDARERFLYVSNRGHDSIGVFSVGADARLTPAQYSPSGGAWPWCFLITETAQMVVANHRSDSVAIFTIKPDGTLSQTGETFSVSRPQFVGTLSGASPTQAD